jgi:hypothetical protein
MPELKDKLQELLAKQQAELKQLEAAEWNITSINSKVILLLL